LTSGADDRYIIWSVMGAVAHQVRDKSRVE
jgi:hypothetical protein